MDANEWCAVAHVDIGGRSGLDEVVELIGRLVLDADGSAGTVELSALRVNSRPNHFEVVGRYRSDAAYRDHLITPMNLTYREAIAPILGSPFEDRLHGPRGNQQWPPAVSGDPVVITQLELRPGQLDEALAHVDEFAARRREAPGLVGQIVLQRHYLPNNLELFSVWDSPDAFDEYLATDEANGTNSLLDGQLLAPIDDRRYTLIAGQWSTP